MRLTAMNTARTVSTRLLTTAKHSPEMENRLKLAQVLQIVFQAVDSFQDEDGEVIAAPLRSCPSRKLYVVKTHNNDVFPF